MNTSRRGFFKVITGSLIAILVPSTLLADEPKLISQLGGLEEFKCDNWTLRLRLFNNNKTKPMLKGRAIPHNKFYPEQKFKHYVDPDLYETDEEYKMKCIDEINKTLSGLYKHYKNKYFESHA